MPHKSNISKINIYSALSGCYFPPDENLNVFLDQLEQNIGSWIPEAQKLVISMIAELQNQENGLTELILEYSRLFLGPFEVLAPPFGSVYLNPNKKMVMDETTNDVVDLYLRAGLDVDENFNNLPDHITAELEFMHYLYFQLHAALSEDKKDQADEFQKLKTDFFHNHLGKWGITFTDKVRENAQMDFYRRLGQVTRMVLSAEAGEHA